VAGDGAITRGQGFIISHSEQKIYIAAQILKNQKNFMAAPPRESEVVGDKGVIFCVLTPQIL
jgi:hypothetical protein